MIGGAAVALNANANANRLLITDKTLGVVEADADIASVELGNFAEITEWSVSPAGFLVGKNPPAQSVSQSFGTLPASKHFGGKVRQVKRKEVAKPSFAVTIKTNYHNKSIVPV